MAVPHAQSGDVVSVLPLGPQLAESVTTAILKAEQLEVMRVVLLAGKSLPEHSVQGEITVLCIEGRIAFGTSTTSVEMGPGDFIHLQRDEPHNLQALVDSSALLTICLSA